MGRRRREREHSINKSQTLPPSPSHSFSSSSSSDFEFTISLTPQKPSCPADELFYKGQLLPLQRSPRLSMVRTLLLASPSSSSETTTASRDSTGSSSNDSNSSFTDCDSARPSSVTEEEEEEDVLNPVQIKKPSNKYFSLSRFSSVFRKDGKNREAEKNLKKPSSTKEVIRKYLKKVKPLYDKLSSSPQKQKPELMEFKFKTKLDNSVTAKISNGFFPNSSGNLKYPRRRCVSSCPSSIRSSPTHSYSILPRTSLETAKSIGSATTNEELQSAIQGAITHCKNSMIQSK